MTGNSDGIDRSLLKRFVGSCSDHLRAITWASWRAYLGEWSTYLVQFWSWQFDYEQAH